MLLGDNPSKSALYWQAAKDYKWRVLRLAILLTVLSILVVATIPSTYVATVKLAFFPVKPTSANTAYFPFAKTVNHKELGSEYEARLLANVAKGVVAKLSKFKLTDVDSGLATALTEYVVIAQIKQKARAILPFMPQQDLDLLSPKQLSLLKNNYTLEHIIQNLHQSYSSSQNEITIEYKDSDATFAMIIAKLAADIYPQSIAETKMHMPEHVEQQITPDSIQSPALIHAADINIGNYTTRLLKPNRFLIVSLSFLLSIFVLSALVLILVRLKTADSQKNSSCSPMQNSKTNT